MCSKAYYSVYLVTFDRILIEQRTEKAHGRELRVDTYTAPCGRDNYLSKGVSPGLSQLFTTWWSREYGRNLLAVSGVRLSTEVLFVFYFLRSNASPKQLIML